MLFEALASGGGSDWYYTILMKAPLGSDITIDDGSEEVTAEGAGDTIIGIPVHNPSSTYNISVVASGFTKTSSATTPATSGGISSLIEVQFGEIDLTFDDEFRGLSATITNEAGTKTTTVTLPSTGNTDTLFVPDLGKWIISSTVSGDTFTAEATIGSFSVPESAELAVIPNGKTVLPVNSIEKWLLCGNIKDKQYTTLSEVLADEDTLRKLLTDDNAIDYLKRSTEWAVNPGLIPMATGDDPTHIKSSHDHAPDGAMAYYAYYAFDRNDNTRWNGSNTTNEEWLEYDFDTPTCVRRIYIKPCIYSNKKMVKHAYFQAYDTTQSDWISLKEISLANDSVEEYYFDIDNNTNYTRYRLLCDESYYIEGSYYGFSIWELQFYTYAECITESELAMSYIGAYDYAVTELMDDNTWADALTDSEYDIKVFNNLVPEMTDYTTPKGEVIELDPNHNTEFLAYRAFEDNNRFFSPFNGGYTNYYIGYKYPRPVENVYAVKMVAAEGVISGGRIYNMLIQSSSDGGTWVDNEAWANRLPYALYNSSNHTVPLENCGNFKKLLNITNVKGMRLNSGTDSWSTSGSHFIEMPRLQFLGRSRGGVQNLLKLAGVDRPYTTIDELLADHVTLQKVISSHAAIDYLVTAKYFIDAITSDATAMRYIGKRNYAADTLLADSDWLDGIRDSEYFESVLNGKIPTMTGPTTPEGVASTNDGINTGYEPWRAFDDDEETSRWSTNTANQSAGKAVQYEFATPLVAKYARVKSFYIGNTLTLKNYKLQGSNDGFVSDIHDLYQETAPNAAYDKYIPLDNDTAYKYYRLLALDNSYYSAGYVNVVVLQFWGRRDVDESYIDVYSAENDSFYEKDASGNIQILGTTSNCVAQVPRSDGSTPGITNGVHTLYSSVAKNPNDLTEDYFKTVKVDDSTIEIMLMPDDALYWYGYKGENLEECSTANGWSYGSGDYFVTPTYQTQKIYADAGSTDGGRVYFGSRNLIKDVDVHCIRTGISAYMSTNYHGMYICANKNTGDFSNGAQFPSVANVMDITHVHARSDGGYIETGGFRWGGQNASNYIHALWADKNAEPTYLSAAYDTLYILDGNRQIPIATTNGEGKSFDALLEPGTYDIYSSVAKDPTNLSNPYHKQVTITAATQTVKIMPENTLYWYGYVDANCGDISTANGWVTTSGDSFVNPTYNTNNVVSTTSAWTQFGGLSAINPVLASKVYLICQGVTPNPDSAYGWLSHSKSKNIPSSDTGVVNLMVNSNSLAKWELAVDYTGYPSINQQYSSNTIYALWYE